MCSIFADLYLYILLMWGPHMDCHGDPIYTLYLYDHNNVFGWACCTTLFQYVFPISNLTHDLNITEMVKFAIFSANLIFPFLCPRIHIPLSPSSVPKYLIVFDTLIPLTYSNQKIISWFDTMANNV